jgi:N-acetylneuraminate synthase/N,N'-diacetyllegionaminate synthase
MAARGSFSIGTVTIGAPARCFVIAEAGVNHNGNVDLAHRLIDAAAEAGADAVKFQTFEPEALASASAPKALYQQRDGGSESQLAMLRRLVLSRDVHESLRDHAHERGLIFLSTPFEESSAEFLAALGVPAFKIASGEITNLPFLASLAARGRPLLLSTGMSSLDEVGEAVATIRNAGAPPLALLHCTSSYPAPTDVSNLRAMQTMRSVFGVAVGYSDHTLGIEVPLAAVALGAELLEKHLTLDRTLPGPDHAASMEPDAFATMVRGIRVVEGALGDGEKRVQECERETQLVARKSLCAARDLPSGHVVAPDDLVARRPGSGISPARLGALVGRRLRRSVAGGRILEEGDLE